MTVRFLFLLSSSPFEGISRTLSILIMGMTVPRIWITSFACTSLMSSGRTSSIVWIDPSAIAYFSSPITTMSAWMIASVSGSLIIHEEPSPKRFFTSTSPLSDSIFDFTTSSPTPRPDTSDTFFAVEKLGRNRRSMTSFSVIVSACSGVTVPRSIALFLTASTLIPPPSSRTSITTLFPS